MIRKMRILVLNYEYPPLGGGAAPVTKELAEEISSRGHHIDIITMGYKGLPCEEKQKNVTIYRVPSIRIKKEKSNFLEMSSFIIPAYRKAACFLSKNRYSLIHSHFILPTGFIARRLSKKFNIPYIITSHGSDVPGYNPDRFKMMHKFLKGTWKKIVEDSSLVITPSESLKKLILASIRKKEIEVIPNGIHISGPDIEHSKEKIVLYAGRLFPRKGVQYLIEASDFLPKGWRIIIAGDGDYRKTLEKIAQNKKNVFFKGWLPKEVLDVLYSKSSIFVLPSDEESFGMVIVEAMLNKNAIITTKGTACEEVIGNSGLLMERKNTGDLKNLLKRLTEDTKLLKSYQKKAYQKVKQYDWKNIAGSYLNIYERTSI